MGFIVKCDVQDRTRSFWLDTPMELDDRLWLLYHYWQERKSTVEIGREIGTSATAVKKALEYWKIPKRDSPRERMEELEV